MNEDFNGSIFCVITGNRCTFANELNKIIKAVEVVCRRSINDLDL